MLLNSMLLLKAYILPQNSLSISSVQSLSHVWLFNPMDCSTPGFPFYLQLLEPAQTHFHWVGDAIQPSHPLLSPFPIWNQSVVPRPVLTVASDLHTGFSRGRSGGLVFPSLLEFSSLLWSTVKGFGIVNKAEIGVFLELSCFFSDPADVGNLISGSSAFSKTSLNIWKFTVHILLKPGLENFKHCFTSVWD